MIRTALGIVLLLLLGGVHVTESGAPVTAGPAVLVHDFFPGASEGAHPPAQLTRLGRTLFFIGDDRESGPTSRLVSRPSAREREAQAKRALEPRWRRMLR
jgi:hypothetical protein